MENRKSACVRLPRPIQVQAGMERSVGAGPIPESPFPIPGSYRPNNIRPGFSSWFLMSTRNCTESLPSMMRWS
ncbi:hypothetical protein CFBP498_37370 [Xanthomonas hortorum pv. vitians]|uniref:Uncharacterized protein n=1 Tax=Xanthomonas hortorum pv. vitians TaxID=83224 RepID=A0A6V7EM37_9XANT|nr:hypothetical protein CFBP498_37370 [Xanthomonas hortorum pv. vitians]CAD0352294.1 hypothetical protein CFBP498_37370 [Xanthomonas hortorum pv. vitians]